MINKTNLREFIRSNGYAWPGASLYCDHPGREIPSAYGETEE